MNRNRTRPSGKSKELQAEHHEKEGPQTSGSSERRESIVWLSEIRQIMSPYWAARSEYQV